MTRLTKVEKIRIRNRVVDSGFEERLKRMKLAGVALGDRAYAKTIPKKDRDYMSQASKGYFPTTKYLIARCFYSKGCSDWMDVSLDLSSNQNIPFGRWGNGRPFVVLKETDSLSAKVIEWAKANEALHNEKFEARRMAENILDSCTTVSKLLKVWPEIAPYVTPTKAETKAIALPITKVNEALGL